MTGRNISNLMRPFRLPDSVSSPVVTPLSPSVVYASRSPDELDAQYVKGVKKVAKQPYREYARELVHLLEANCIEVPPGPGHGKNALGTQVQGTSKVEGKKRL